MVERLVLVTGTATEVGKTFVGAALARELRARGRTVSARKPVQSFETGPTDAEVLAAATGEEPDDVCPEHRWYPRAMAPFMAAEVLGRPPILLHELLGELRWPEVEVGLLELAGGVRSPITSDGADAIDVARWIEPHLVVLVADAGLGTLNAVRLCLDALDAHDVIVVLNRWDGSDLHRRNADWLARNAAASVVTDAAALADLV